MGNFVTRNTYSTTMTMHPQHVYGFIDVCKYWDYREE